MARGGSSHDSRHVICYLLAQLTEEERFCSGRRGDRSPTCSEAEGEGDSIGKRLKGTFGGKLLWSIVDSHNCERHDSLLVSQPFSNPSSV